MEIIVSIRYYEGKDGDSNVAGFEVVTTQQTIRLLIDNDSSCCETWGIFWCNDEPAGFVGAKLRGVSLADAALNEAQMKVNDLDPSDERFDGGVMFVNIDTDRGVLQFVAYNQRNGYVGHKATIHSRQLTHAEVL